MKEREAFAAELAELDRKRDDAARQVFDKSAGLEKAIYEQIVPAIKLLNIEGVRGTAWAFAPGWIVSNSHVVAELESLQAGRFANQAILPDAERAFFRPKKLGNHPDIMMAKIGEYEGVGAIPNPLAIDPLYEPVRYFTIDYGYEDPIRWLTHHEDSLDGYSTFTFEDGDLPSQGLSGAPIMAASLRKEAKTPTWSFSLHSMVFAYKADTNHVCNEVMPIACSLLLKKRLAVPQAGKGVKQPGSKQSAKATKIQKRGQSGMGTLSFDKLENDRVSVYKNLKDKASELDGGKYVEVSETPDTKAPCIVAESNHFRIDYLGCLESGYYLFALQDNILGSDGKPVQINGKAASSTFAMAKIYTESKYIDVDILLQVLQQSEKKAAYFYKRNHADALCSSTGSKFVEAMASEYGEEVGEVDRQKGTFCLKTKNSPLKDSHRFDKDDNSVFVEAPVKRRVVRP